jgi:hypothetical protein
MYEMQRTSHVSNFNDTISKNNEHKGKFHDEKFTSET